MEYGVASHGAVLAAAPLVARPTWLLLSPPPPASSIQIQNRLYSISSLPLKAGPVRACRASLASSYTQTSETVDLDWENLGFGIVQTDYMYIAKCGTACKLKLGDSKGALLDADFALRETEGNAKAFFRQGQAHIALNDIDAAMESFKHALELEPNDAGIKRELAAAKKKIADRRDQERKAFARMFQPSGKSDKSNEENN